TRSTRPASTSWVDDSGCGFMQIVGSSVFGGRLSLNPPELSSILLQPLATSPVKSTEGCTRALLPLASREPARSFVAGPLEWPSVKRVSTASLRLPEAIGPTGA